MTEDTSLREKALRDEHDVVAQLKGRAQFIRRAGGIKSAAIMEEAIRRIEALEADNKLYRSALEDVVSPLNNLRREAEAKGCQLNGLAYSIANDLGFVQGIASDALAAQARGLVMWPIETDDQVEALARECDWDNRKYMTATDYAIWCSRMRKFAKLAALSGKEGQS